MFMLSLVDELLRLWGANIETGRKAVTPEGNVRRSRDDSTPCMTQDQLAKLVGVRQSTVARWEAGAYAPRDHHKIRIATVLHQDVRQLFPLIRMAV